MGGEAGFGTAVVTVKEAPFARLWKGCRMPPNLELISIKEKVARRVALGQHRLIAKASPDERFELYLGPRRLSTLSCIASQSCLNGHLLVPSRFCSKSKFLLEAPMYVVKCGTGYVCDKDSLLMTSVLDEAVRLSYLEACEVSSLLAEQGYSVSMVYDTSEQAQGE